MADFYAPGRVDAPDLLGSFYRGAMAPGMLQGQQQQLQAGALNLQQLKQAMAFNQMRLDMYPQVAQYLQNNSAAQGGREPYAGTSPSGAQNPAASTGGITNGPQGAVQGTGYAAPTQDVTDPNAYSAGMPPSRVSADTIAAVGLLAPDVAKDLEQRNANAAQDYQQKLTIAQQQAKPILDVMKAESKSPDAARFIANNDQFYEGWKRYAAMHGLNYKTDLTPFNAQRALAMGHDMIASKLILPTIGVPEQFAQVDVGQGGQANVNLGTGQMTTALPREAPTYSIEKRYNATTGKEEAFKVQTGGWGAGGGAGGVGGSGTIDLGYPKPGPEAPRQAAFAESMRNSVATLRGLEQRGIALTPTQRTQVIKIATDEGGNALSQWAQQMALKKNLGPDAQAYLAAMMPVIQAVSHDQGGARLNASQIRANLESIIPVDVKNAKAMEQINSTRDTFYKSMAYGAGALAHAPGFQQTVGADLDRMRSGPPAPPKVGDVIKGHRYMGGPPSSPSSWSKVGG